MRKSWILGALILGGPALRGHEAPSQYVVGATLLSAAPTIDGRLDEKVWEEAALLDGFTQLEPESGAPSSEKTEVLIGYDEKKLYFGVRCYYSQPGKIVSIVMDRDGQLAHEDSVQIVLDTFLDHQNGFFFAVNPLGAQVDALVRNEGDEVNYSWDGVWYSATERHETHWTAEIAIPFRVLRFPRAASQTWGLNVLRAIIHRREYAVWKPVPRLTGGTALLNLSQAGELNGLENIQPGSAFEYRPYVLARADNGASRDDGSSFEVGIEVKRNITSNLVLDLTYNLDFAEVEADNQQVNLTRFKLFFPEQRDFFLEGASSFYIGERADYLKPPEKIFFFSRRIGLTADGQREIPVLGGAKLTGKLGGLGIGFLNLTTDDLTYRDRNSDDEPKIVPKANYTVLRLKKDIFKKSAIGFMWLNQEVLGDDNQEAEIVDNHGAAIDWEFAVGNSLKSGGYFAQTSKPGFDDADWAGSADLVWDSEHVFAKAVYTEIGEDFSPDMGFFTRTGIREWRGNFTYDFNPRFWGLRDIYVFDDLTYVTDRQGNLETRVNRTEVDLIWGNLSILAIKYFDNFEDLKVPFMIRPGIEIPAGRYNFENYFIGAQTSPGKPVMVFARLLGGEFYDGDFNTEVLGTRLRPMNGLSLKIAFEHNDVKLPAGSFVDDLFTLEMTWSMTPRISTRSLIEWRRDDNFSAKIIFRWIYRPGSSFYVVYDEFHDLVERPGGALDARARALIAKASLFF